MRGVHRKGREPRKIEIFEHARAFFPFEARPAAEAARKTAGYRKRGNPRAPCAAQSSLAPRTEAAQTLCVLALVEHIVSVEPAFDRAGVEAIFRIDHERVHLLFLEHRIERIGELDFPAHARLHVGQKLHDARA